MTTLHVFCTKDNYTTCPRLMHSDSSTAVRPFYLIDQDHPRGVAFLNEEEIDSLPIGGVGNVQVTREGTDTKITDAFGNTILMSGEYFSQLLEDITNGSVASAVSQMVGV